MNPDPHRVLWWIVGAVLGPLVLAVFTSLMNTAIATSQRASALEAHWLALDRRIQRIEEKVDRLLDQRRNDEPRP